VTKAATDAKRGNVSSNYKKSVYGYSPFLDYKKPEVYSGFSILCQVVYSKTKETETLDTISISPIANVSFGWVASLSAIIPLAIKTGCG
jgi:hypothetical protein